MYLSCCDKKIEYGNKTLIMGIVNITPDSFSDGGIYFNYSAAAFHAMDLSEEGADIIDLGAQSTRPGYEEISPQEEWKRLKDALYYIKKNTNVPISVDTYYPYVAKKAIENGADIINDISGVFNEKMAKLIKDSGALWIITHNGEGSINEVKQFFEEIAEKCITFGIKKEQLCFDPGIGFGKDYSENLELIGNVEKYKLQGFPLLIGFSRKRVIGTASGENIPYKRTFGNISADTAAVFGGADIIRLHDVKNEIKGIRTAEEIKKWIK